MPDAALVRTRSGVQSSEAAPSAPCIPCAFWIGRAADHFKTVQTNSERCMGIGEELGRARRARRALFSLAMLLPLTACAPAVERRPDTSTSSALAPSSCRAIDGDTIDCGSTRIRLVNVDTPELRGGCASEIALARRAQGFTAAALGTARTIEIKVDPRRPRDRNGRTLAWVVLDGRDLGEALVAARLARVWDGRRRPWCP